MKSLRLAISAMSFILLVPTTSFADEALLSAQSTQTERYMPEAAETAIDKSQGIFEVTIPVLSGQPKKHVGSAFLVSGDGIIVTARHNLPEEVHLLKADDTMTFAGTPVKVHTIMGNADFVFLKLAQIPDGMRPAVFAKEAPPLYTEVFAKLDAMLPSDARGTFRVIVDLPFRAKIVSYVMEMRYFQFGVVPTGLVYLYLDKAVMPGFSGGMFVNAAGEAVGLAIEINGGFTILISGSNIQVALEDIQKNKVDEKDDKKNP